MVRPEDISQGKIVIKDDVINFSLWQSQSCPAKRSTRWWTGGSGGRTEAKLNWERFLIQNISPFPDRGPVGRHQWPMWAGMSLQTPNISQCHHLPLQLTPHHYYISIVPLAGSRVARSGLTNHWQHTALSYNIPPPNCPITQKLISPQKDQWLGQSGLSSSVCGLRESRRVGKFISFLFVEEINFSFIDLNTLESQSDWDNSLSDGKYFNFSHREDKMRERRVKL